MNILLVVKRTESIFVVGAARAPQMTFWEARGEDRRVEIWTRFWYFQMGAFGSRTHAQRVCKIILPDEIMLSMGGGGWGGCLLDLKTKKCGSSLFWQHQHFGRLFVPNEGCKKELILRITII